MHKTQNYFDTHILNTTQGWTPTTLTLTPYHANNLQTQLLEDAKDYLFSAAVSIGDAIRGIERELYSWATVKLYYALFYAIRGQLAVTGTAIIYHRQHSKHTPYRLDCITGSTPTKLSGNTHKVILDQFTHTHPTSALLSQQIGTDEPFVWIMERREEANYKNAHFYEPDTPSFFNNIVRQKLRSTIDAYINDDTLTYTFDPDHAILALPLFALAEGVKSLAHTAPTMTFTEDEVTFLTDLYGDKHGPYTAAKKIFEAVH